MKVLIVEDEEDIRELYEDWLEDRECEVTAVTNGKDAITLLQSNKFNLIITDLSMPENSGEDLIHFLRFVENDQTTKVMVISGQATEGKEETTGVVYIEKPIMRDKFLKAYDSIV